MMGSAKRYRTLILLLLVLFVSSFDFPPHVETFLVPFIPFVPFLPVTAADFIPRDTPFTYNLRNRKISTEQKKNSDESDFEFQQASPTPPSLPVLVCLGDSLTHGSVSSNWVSSLSLRLTKTTKTPAPSSFSSSSCSYTVLNAGKNSETAAAARLRLEEIISLRPAAVTIMIGTNDLIGSLDETAGQMYQSKLWWAQKTAPTLDAYAIELDEIITELEEQLLKKNYGRTRIAVLSPPPLGEGGPESFAWKQGAKMANICSERCNRSPYSGSSVTYIPLYEQVKEEMMNNLLNDEEGMKGEIGKQSCSSSKSKKRDFSFREAIPLTSIIVPWRLLLLNHSFSEVRRANGYRYTIDSIHFGKEFAQIVEDLVYQWVTDAQSIPTDK